MSYGPGDFRLSTQPPRPERAAFRIYVAAPWVHQFTARLLKAYLQQCDFDVVSTWTEQADTSNLTDLMAHAQSDYDQLRQADAMVLLNLVKSEGKACETGIALERGIPIFLMGGRENNIFLKLPRRIMEVFSPRDLAQELDKLAVKKFQTAALRAQTAQTVGGGGGDLGGKLPQTTKAFSLVLPTTAPPIQDCSCAGCEAARQRRGLIRK